MRAAWRALCAGLVLLIFRLSSAAADTRVVNSGEELVRQLLLWAAQDQQPVELLIAQNLTAPDDAYSHGIRKQDSLTLGPGLTITGIGRPVLDLNNRKNVLGSVVSRSLQLRNVIIVNGCEGCLDGPGHLGGHPAPCSKRV